MLSLPYSSIYSFFFFSPSLLQTFDKCFLGSSETADANRMFCGQMGAVFLFGEALSAAQILAIYQLGPGYKVQNTPLIHFHSFACECYDACMHESYEGSWMYCILHSFIHSN